MRGESERTRVFICYQERKITFGRFLLIAAFSSASSSNTKVCTHKARAAAATAATAAAVAAAAGEMRTRLYCTDINVRAHARVLRGDGRHEGVGRREKAQGRGRP